MASVSPDANDVLFIKCNGTTTSFVDSSTAQAAKVITANGNATQLSIPSAFSGRRTAMFFNGTTDYVAVPDSANWDFGTGDFFIELYFNTSSVAADLVFVDRNAGSDFKFFWDQSEGKYSFVAEGNADLSSASTPSINTWYKIKVARVSGTITFYVNDVATGTAAVAENIQGTAALVIGATSTPDTFFPGWIKNLVIDKAGTTVLDLRANSPASSPLAPAIAFDGSGDSIYVADHDDFNMGDFTCEAFFNFSTVGAAQGIFGYDSTTDAGGINLHWNNSGMKFEAAVSGTTKTDWTYNAAANKWFHVALVRASGVVSLYADGQPLSGTLSNADTLAPSNNFHLGTRDTIKLNGFAREWRVSNVARYSAAFTPSQTGFSVDANTKLYVKGNEANGVATFIDSETSAKTVTTVNDAKIKYTEDYRSCIFKDESASAHKPYPQGSAKVDFFSAFGSGAGYFDGSGDAISSDDSGDWDFGTGTFTLETFMRPVVAKNMYIFSRKTEASGNLCDIAYTTADSSWQFYINNAVRTGASAIYTLIANQWVHIAATRDGSNNTKLFINGTLVGAGSTDTFDIQGDQPYFIGNYSSLSTNGVNGLLDNIRISKGIARYTAAFNPPEDVPSLGGSRVIWFI